MDHHFLSGWLLAALLLCFINSINALNTKSQLSDTQTLFPHQNPTPDIHSASAPRCLPTNQIPIAHANLTAEEIDLLDSHICWPADPSRHFTLNENNDSEDDGIPPGVSCTPTSWCDSGHCTRVCARGSVTVDPWLTNALRLQARLARSLPFCYSTFFGTHNSAITLADGYGNLDPIYQSLFKYVKWASKDFSHALLRTNNQWLSLTDQLHLGVRVVEVDTHWFGGVLRIAHCGGLHVGPLNTIVKALNAIAKLLGHHIRWDTETMGCDPSLSSIPALLQRTLEDALKEIKEWMDRPENEDEFVVLFFDDQPNLGEWGVAKKLQETAVDVFGAEAIYSRTDLQIANNKWPTAAEMVVSGRRVLLISVADYGEAMEPFIFPRGDLVCQWQEPSLSAISTSPECSLSGLELFSGQLIRVSSCELEYGPLNCEFVWNGGNAPYFDETSIPGVLDCGVNIPSPDLLTPSRAAASVWSWAAGYPSSFDNSSSPSSSSTSSCALISATDGRWRTTSDCSALNIPSVCRIAGTPLDNDDQWVLSTAGTALSRGLCPEGSSFDIPRHPRENSVLAGLMREKGVDAAWLPVEGPGWAIDGVPAFV